MKFTIVLFLFLYYFVDSCGLVLPTNKRDVEDFNFEFIEEQSYLVDQLRWSRIHECVRSDTSTASLLSLTDDELLIQYNDGGNDFAENRKVIKIGNLQAFFNQKSLNDKNEFVVFHCVNDVGFVVLSRLIKTSRDLDQQELKKLLHLMNEYKYDFSSSTKCLECGLFTFKVGT